MEVITAKSYFKHNILPFVKFLGIGICILIFGECIRRIEIDPNSIFIDIQKIVHTIVLLIGFFVSFLPLFFISISFILFFNDTIKYYNEICISQWRKDLLALGFIEILPREKGDSQFGFRGIYAALPLQINNIENYQTIEILIPLNVEIDENFTTYQQGFSKQYASQNIGISQERIFKTIKIADAVEDKNIWAAVHELQNIVNEAEYKEQKLVNYLKFEKL